METLINRNHIKLDDNIVVWSMSGGQVTYCTFGLYVTMALGFNLAKAIKQLGSSNGWYYADHTTLSGAYLGETWEEALRYLISQGKASVVAL